MKKFILSSLLILFSVVLNAQTLAEFNKARTHRVVYDDNFNPTLILDVNNISKKIITSIEVTVEFGEYDPYNWSSTAVKKYISSTSISPGYFKEVSFKVHKDINGRKPASFYISGVRFADGTICVE